MLIQKMTSLETHVVDVIIMNRNTLLYIRVFLNVCSKLPKGLDLWIHRGHTHA